MLLATLLKYALDVTSLLSLEVDCVKWLIKERFYTEDVEGVLGVFMGKCPDCMKEYQEYKKKWKFGKFDVEAFTCECGTDFREYKTGGKHSFTLKKAEKDKTWKKPES